MKVLFHEKLSPHKYKTSEGYLVCMDAVIARTGEQEYYRRELFPDCKNGDEVIKVGRDPKEVFSKETIASFENKPLTCEHPDEDVIPVNYKDYAVGFARDVRQGTYDGQDVLLANLFITDPDIIEDVENGVRTELSCGYNCDITDGDNPQQINIRGNHIALCECGRAGCAKIIDSMCNDNLIESKLSNFKGDYHIDHDHVDVPWDDVDDFIEYCSYRSIDLKREPHAPYGHDRFRLLISSRDSSTDPSQNTEKEYAVSRKFDPDGTLHWMTKEDAETKAVSLSRETGESYLHHSSHKGLVTIAHYKRGYLVESFEDSAKKAKDPDYIALFEDFPKQARQELREAKNKHKTLIELEGNLQDLVRRFPETERAKAIEDANKILEDLKREFDITDDYTITDQVMKMPQSDKRKLSRYLGTISKFVKNDPDVSQIVEQIESSIDVEGKPIKLIREKIDGWNKMDDGMMRKDYIFSVEGYNNHLLISLYADPSDYVVNEVSAYVLDSQCSNHDSEEYKIENKNGKYVVNFNGTEQAFDTENEANDYAKSEVDKAKSMLRDKKIKKKVIIDLDHFRNIDISAVIDSCKTRVTDDQTQTFKHDLRLAMESARNELEDIDSEVDNKYLYQYAKKAKKKALKTINRGLRPDVFKN